MTQLNLSTEVQQVTKGAIVLGAVLLQRPEARLLMNQTLHFQSVQSQLPEEEVPCR